jgi:hypothetical protein
MVCYSLKIPEDENNELEKGMTDFIGSGNI